MDTAAQAITDSAQNMQKIVHDVLNFSKPVQLALKEEDMRNIVNQACDACREKAAGGDISLSIDMPDYTMNILVDGFYMVRALVNLINNALEASGNGQGVIITVAVKNKHVEISIKDHGAGMDKETVGNIFVAFYTKKILQASMARVNPATKSVRRMLFCILPPIKDGDDSLTVYSRRRKMQAKNKMLRKEHLAST